MFKTLTLKNLLYKRLNFYLNIMARIAGVNIPQNKLVQSWLNLYLWNWRKKF